jgi:mRNA-degrading endonuclease RelE of RelBE toxin-antitoxin system
MTFTSIFSDQLKEIIIKLHSKDKQVVIELNKKMLQIMDCDKDTINHYKNLRCKLFNYKRVHIGKSFVLFFSVDLKNNIIYFVKFSHHDKIYKK